MDTNAILHISLPDLISRVDRIGREDMLDMMTGIKDRNAMHHNNNNANNKNANNSNHNSNIKTNNNNNNMQHLSFIKVNRPENNIQTMCRATTQPSTVEHVFLGNMILLQKTLNQRQWGLRVGVDILQYF